jgi:hypothetical protein
MSIIKFPQKISPEIRAVLELAGGIDSLLAPYLSGGGNITLLVAVMANRLGEVIRSNQPTIDKDLYEICNEILVRKILGGFDNGGD